MLHMITLIFYIQTRHALLANVVLQQVRCDIRTVSWAMSSLGVERIDLLKIDVEGSELVSRVNSNGA